MTEEEMKVRYANLPQDVRERFEETARVIGLDLAFLNIQPVSHDEEGWPVLSKEEKGSVLKQVKKMQDEKAAMKSIPLA